MATTGTTSDAANPLAAVIESQARSALSLFEGLIAPTPAKAEAEAVQWAQVAGRLQTLWTDFQVQQLAGATGRKSDGARDAESGSASGGALFDPARWVGFAETVLRQLPLAEADVQQSLWSDALELANRVLGGFGIGAQAQASPADELPLQDRRFVDPQWREQPFFALLHQLYLLLSQRMLGLAEAREGLDAAQRRQLVFATRALTEALSPANFPLTNPVALARAAETRGESLVKGLEHLLADMRRGQLTHTQPGAFVVGENIATTPGKVIHETPLFQLIQYTPTTERVLKVPLVIFPPWINRFYILDLNARKSFVRWAVEQGVTVFMVSWRSADASLADVTWDDYIAAQIEAIDLVRQRLAVPSVHTIGYCVAGTTLAAALAVLARKGEADKVASATFFTAQVDFEEAGDLKSFIGEQQLGLLEQLTPEGYLDGRYLAATFNLLRGNDLIWNYVERNYLKGEDYPAFDLLHWNGDVTNLPARWHRAYLRDLYRDNRLVVPDSLEACGAPIDLRRIATPCYIQAGREDHIAPPRSVWKLTRHLSGPWTFMLAGSGHIAGVVNPPSDGKYQYWTHPGGADTLERFREEAQEHPGSWWPHWRDWLESIDTSTVSAKGKRRPGGRGDRVIEDAPGRYVMTR